MAHLPVTLGVAFILLTMAWPISVALKDVSIVDVLWAPTFALVAWTIVLAQHGADTGGWIAAGLVTVWAARLGTHLFRRWRRSGEEDHRYTTIRKKFGTRFPFLSLFIVFWLQAFLLWVISWPLQAAVAAEGDPSPLALLGSAMTLAGIVIEAVADLQLSAFRAAPASGDRVLDTGLWRYSRHPNYFGDFLIWWGFFVAGIGAGGPWWTIVSPLIMSALLMHFSGAGLMEDTIGDRRPAYKTYIQRTSRFFPRPPREARTQNPSP
jgi:steroid 5-alpha reductase family enzyme